MASSKDYLDFILDQLSELDDITYRAMIGIRLVPLKDRSTIASGIYKYQPRVGK